MEIYWLFFDNFFSNKMFSAHWKGIYFKEILFEYYLFCLNFKM